MSEPIQLRYTTVAVKASYDQETVVNEMHPFWDFTQSYWDHGFVLCANREPSPEELAEITANFSEIAGGRK